MSLLRPCLSLGTKAMPVNLTVVRIIMGRYPAVAQDQMASISADCSKIPHGAQLYMSELPVILLKRKRNFKALADHHFSWAFEEGYCSSGSKPKCFVRVPFPRSSPFHKKNASVYI